MTLVVCCGWILVDQWLQAALASSLAEFTTQLRSLPA